MAKHVIGLGLPRTGGTTLAEALRTLGYYGTNSCVVTNVTTTTAPKNVFANGIELGKTFLVDNEIPANFMTMSWSEFCNKYDITPETKFILTTRNEVDWLKSLAKFNRYPMRGTDIPLKREYEELVENVIPSERLLMVDWTLCQDTCWKSLCDFLEEPSVNVDNLLDFPCENC